MIANTMRLASCDYNDPSRKNSCTSIKLFCMKTIFLRYDHVLCFFQKFCNYETFIKTNSAFSKPLKMLEKLN